MGVIAPLSGSYSLLALRPSDFCLNGAGGVGKERQFHSQGPRHPAKGPGGLPSPVKRKAERKLVVIDQLAGVSVLGDFSFSI